MLLEPEQPRGWLSSYCAGSRSSSTATTLTAYGTVVPVLLADKAWHLTPATVGTIASWALFGMLLGSLLVGPVTELIGRRRTFLISVTLFSVMMGVAALAASPEMFGAARFLSGLGLGGLMPTAMAMTTEFARRGRRDLTLVAMFTGFSAGGVLAALLGIGDHPGRQLAADVLDRRRAAGPAAAAAVLAAAGVADLPGRGRAPGRGRGAGRPLRRAGARDIRRDRFQDACASRKEGGLAVWSAVNANGRTVVPDPRDPCGCKTRPDGKLTIDQEES